MSSQEFLYIVDNIKDNVVIILMRLKADCLAFTLLREQQRLRSSQESKSRSGRFDLPANELVEKFNATIPFEQRDHRHERHFLYIVDNIKDNVVIILMRLKADCLAFTLLRE